MFRLVRQFGDLLDAIDLGGWLCVSCGVTILAVTVLAPAWLDVRQLRYERSILTRQAALLEARERNYETFVIAVERNDPMLLQRLAWRHLRLKPADADLPHPATRIQIDNADLDEWMRPTASQAIPIAAVQPLPNTKLVRLVLGPSRPWVLAFGGWLILIGLLITPVPKA